MNPVMNGGVTPLSPHLSIKILKIKIDITAN